MGKQREGEKWRAIYSLSICSLSHHCISISHSLHVLSLSIFSFSLYLLSIFSSALHFLFIFSFSRHFLGSGFPASLNLCRPDLMHKSYLFPEFWPNLYCSCTQNHPFSFGPICFVVAPNNLPQEFHQPQDNLTHPFCTQLIWDIIFLKDQDII